MHSLPDRKTLQTGQLAEISFLSNIKKKITKFPGA